MFFRRLVDIYGRYHKHRAPPVSRCDENDSGVLLVIPWISPSSCVIHSFSLKTPFCFSPHALSMASHRSFAMELPAFTCAIIVSKWRSRIRPRSFNSERVPSSFNYLWDKGLDRDMIPLHGRQLAARRARCVARCTFLAQRGTMRTSQGSGDFLLLCSYM